MQHIIICLYLADAHQFLQPHSITMLSKLGLTEQGAYRYSHIVWHNGALSKCDMHWATINCTNLCYHAFECKIFIIGLIFATFGAPLFICHQALRLTNHNPKQCNYKIIAQREINTYIFPNWCSCLISYTWESLTMYSNWIRPLFRPLPNNLYTDSSRPQTRGRFSLPKQRAKKSDNAGWFPLEPVLLETPHFIKTLAQPLFPQWQIFDNELLICNRTFKQETSTIKKLTWTWLRAEIQKGVKTRYPTFRVAQIGILFHFPSRHFATSFRSVTTPMLQPSSKT